MLEGFIEYLVRVDKANKRANVCNWAWLKLMFSDSCFPLLFRPSLLSLSFGIPSPLCLQHYKKTVLFFVGLFVWVVLFGLGFCFVFCCFSCALGWEAAEPIHTGLRCPSSPGQQLCRVPTGDSDTTWNKGHRRKWKVILCNSCVSCLMRQLVLMCRASWVTSGSF